jgi:hypothetical protein
VDNEVKEFRDTFTRLAVNTVRETARFDYREKSKSTKQLTKFAGFLQLSAEYFAKCTWGPMCAREPPTEKMLDEWTRTLPEPRTPLITLVQIETQIKDKTIMDLNMLWGLIYEAFKGQLDFHLEAPQQVHDSLAFNLMAVFRFVWLHFSNCFRKYLD